MGNPNTGEIYEGALRSEGDVPMDSETAARLRLMDEEARKQKLRELKELLDNMSSSPSPSDLATAYDRIMDSQPDTSVAVPDARRGSDYRSDCEACRRLVAHTKHTLDGDNIREGQAEANPQPDLRTLEGALYLLTSHELDQKGKSAVVTVNRNFETLLRNIWQNLPNGLGAIRAIHAINRARMECNVCITSKGV